MHEIGFQHLFLPVLSQITLFIHLIAFAISLALVAKGDLAILRGDHRTSSHTLHNDAKWIVYLLCILWVTGIGLIALGPGLHPEAIFSNGKLPAKITVVTILTVNGFLLHTYAFPQFSQRHTNMSSGTLAFCLILGAISSVSWVAASLIGASRIIAPFLNYANFMSLYALAISVGLFVALVLVRPVIQRQTSMADRVRQPHSLAPVRGRGMIADVAVERVFPHPHASRQVPPQAPAPFESPLSH